MPSLLAPPEPSRIGRNGTPGRWLMYEARFSDGSLLDFGGLAPPIQDTTSEFFLGGGRNNHAALSECRPKLKTNETELLMRPLIPVVRISLSQGI